MTTALEEQLTYRVIAAFESFVDDLSNWYIRRSRRRFYSYDEAAFRSLWTARVISFTGDSLSLVALMLHVAGTTG